MDKQNQITEETAAVEQIYTNARDIIICVLQGCIRTVVREKLPEKDLAEWGVLTHREPHASIEDLMKFAADRVPNFSEVIVQILTWFEDEIRRPPGELGREDASVLWAKFKSREA